MKKSKSSGSRKHDRNRAWCEAYRRRGQREKNKAKKLRKHLAIYPDDRCAAAALKKAKTGSILGKAA